MKTGKFPFLANSKASIIGRTEGFVKVVAEEKHGELLGVHIIGASGQRNPGRAGGRTCNWKPQWTT